MSGKPQPFDFDSKYVANPTTGCYEWLGFRNENGYGDVRSRMAGRRIRAHRMSYEPRGALHAERRPRWHG